MTPSPQDYRDANDSLTNMVRVEAVRDLIDALPSFKQCSREPELEAAKRAAFEILHTARRDLDAVVTSLLPRLAERLAQQRADDEPEAPFTGPCRNWPDQVSAMTSSDIEAALASRTMEERP